MYWVFIETDFEASHGLTLADGTREPSHAHRWHVTAAVCSPELDEQGLVMDFLELQGIVAAAVEPFSGHRLEDISCFDGKNASAEAVASLLYEIVAGQITPPRRLGYVEVTEAAGCRARYQPNEPTAEK